MDHSVPLERYVNQRLDKITELLKKDKDSTPFFQEVWLKANQQHPHHDAELHVRTPQFDLNTHDEDTEMYVAIDKTVEKMISLIKKEKEKTREKNRKIETEKSDFSSDKYKL